MRIPSGFKRIEAGIAIGVLAVCAVIFIPRGANASEQSRIREVGDELRQMGDSFRQFRRNNGYYPPDTVVGKLPPEMRSRFREDNPFQGLTPIGGQYDYEHRADSDILCVYIVGSSMIEPPTLDDAMALDAYIDDGDLRTGNFRAIDGGFAYAFDRK